MQVEGTTVEGTTEERTDNQVVRSPDDSRQDILKEISGDAAYLAAMMKPFGPLCKTAEEAMAARDEYFSTKMKIPEFADRVQRVRDWASKKRHSEFLTIDGKEYKSVKKFFKQELGVSYEFVRRYTAKNMPRLNFLLEDDQPANPAPPNPPPAKTNPAAAKNKVAPRQGTPQPQVEVLAVHGFDITFSLTEKVQAALSFAADCTEHMSAVDKYEFYSELISKLQDLQDESEENI
jgi:hypothetical protein